MPTTTTFSYTGAQQTFVVPAGVTAIEVDAYGAAGNDGSAPAGGLGGRARCAIGVTPGETLYINVGQQGFTDAGSGVRPFGGGGISSKSGGGASDVRRGGTALGNRVVVAGGGGAPAGAGTGGHGGGLTGGDAQDSVFGSYMGRGGSQSAGGAAGPGGDRVSRPGELGLGGAPGNFDQGYSSNGGGGGGGFYGGGEGGYNSTNFIGYGGGGGSNYFSTTALSNEQGVRSGNGVVTLTYNRPPGAPGVPSVTPNPVNTSGTISWAAGSDPDGDGLVYDLDLSTNGGSSFTPIATGVSGLSSAYDFTSAPATTTAQVRVRSRDGSGSVSAWATSANFTIQHNVAPAAPSLTIPANNSTVNLAAGYTFQVVPQDIDGGDATIAYAMRRKVSGAGAYEYWNASLSAWQSTEIFNSVTSLPKGQTLSIVFGPTKWVNATTYNWSVRTRDTQGLDGVYATDATVTANTLPVVDVLLPSGTVTTTSRPVLTWSFSDAENDAQEAYEAKVFSAAQYGAVGFDPTTSASTWSSGTVLSAPARDVQVSTDLANLGQYRGYVRSRQVGNIWSDWAFEGFTIALDPPASPAVVVALESSSARSKIAIQGRDNNLSASMSTFEGASGAGGWVASTNSNAPAVSTAQQSAGTQSLSFTATANGAISRIRPVLSVPVAPNTPFTARGDMRAGTAARDAQIVIEYRAGAVVIGTVTSPVQALTTTGWTTLVFTDSAAPAGATSAYVYLQANNVLAGEVFYVDQVKTNPGTDAGYTRGGLTGLTTATVEFSDDSGVTWAPVRNGTVALPAATQQAEVIDKELVPGSDRSYRAFVTADI